MQNGFPSFAAGTSISPRWGLSEGRILNWLTCHVLSEFRQFVSEFRQSNHRYGWCMWPMMWRRQERDRDRCWRLECVQNGRVFAEEEGQGHAYRQDDTPKLGGRCARAVI